MIPALGVTSGSQLLLLSRDSNARGKFSLLHRPLIKGRRNSTLLSLLRWPKMRIKRNIDLNLTPVIFVNAHQYNATSSKLMCYVNLWLYIICHKKWVKTVLVHGANFFLFILVCLAYEHKKRIINNVLVAHELCVRGL